MKLYHGSSVEVKNPLISYGRKRVDFGSGFYVTGIKEQAESWSRTISGRRPNGVPIVSCFEFDYDGVKSAGFRCKSFTSYNLEWLAYVIDCRQGGRMCEEYDVVEGGVANDQVIDTVEDFENGIITAEQALGQLAYKKVNHQLCIRSQIIIDQYLHFIGSEKVVKGN